MIGENRNRRLFFIDAETDGLQGAFLTVAIIITDHKYNEEQRYYIGMKKDNLNVTDPWTREHVLPILGEYSEVDSEEELLEEVWNIWREHSDALMIGDVIFPVEARLMQRCIDMNPEERKFQGPYPFLDISSILFAQGYDPDTPRDEILKEICPQDEIVNFSSRQHNALFDVETSILIYKSLMKEIR